MKQTQKIFLMSLYSLRNLENNLSVKWQVLNSTFEKSVGFGLVCCGRPVFYHHNLFLWRHLGKRLDSLTLKNDFSAISTQPEAPDLA